MLAARTAVRCFAGFLLGDNRFSLGIVIERAGVSVERAISQLPLTILRYFQDILEKLGVLCFPFAVISHLSHLLHELTNGLAVLEWAAPLECRAFASHAFVLLNQASVWAHTLAKGRALEHYVVQSDAHRSLEEKTRKVKKRKEKIKLNTTKASRRD